jgi:hypothetical protein
MRFNLRSFIGDKKITKLLVDKLFNKIFISLSNSYIFELSKWSKTVAQGNSKIEYSTLEMAPLKLNES